MFDDENLAKKYPLLHAYTAPVKTPERDIVGRQFEMRKILAAFHRPELCNVILLGEAGSGKALADNTPIPVNDDRLYVNICDLRVGDEVFDEMGQPCKVVGVFPQGQKNAYKMTFSDNSVLICNDEHLWCARTRKQHYDNKPYKVKSLREMMQYGINGRVKSGSYYRYLPNWYIPANSPLQRDSRSFPISPYFMGVLLSKKATFDSLNNIQIITTDENLVDNVIRAIRKSRLSFHKVSVDGCFTLTIKNNINNLNADFVNGELTNKLFMLGSIDQRVSLLRGLLDSDGTVLISNRIDCRYITKNPDMINYIKELCNSLGIRIAVTDYKFNTGKYIIHFDMNDNQKSELFSCKRHLEKIERNLGVFGRKFSKKREDMAVVSVEDTGSMTSMTCIKVDSPNHLFQAGKSHIVTHNTMLVQGTMMRDKTRKYIEVDLSRLIADLKDANEMAAKLKMLFDETANYRVDQGSELVLFIDEFHQIIQLSPAAVEALKPLLADSGTRGIRVIAATTYIEFRKFIAPNQPLVERLQRINLAQPDREMTVSILEGMAKRYGVLDEIPDRNIFELIYEYTNRYIPANSQPRKSILILDSMVGWHRAENRTIDKKLLADVIYESEGVNVAFRVDAKNIKAELDKHVLSQDFATSVIEKRLQVCVADLNDKTRPMSTFLFTGSTGTGKGLTNDTIVPVYKPDGSVVQKRNGDLCIGDFVFNRKGEPAKIVGVFPRGMQDIYKVSLSDGRSICTDSSHLWTYSIKNGSGETYTNSTLELYERSQNLKFNMTYQVPMNKAVRYPYRDVPVHPYVLGAFIGGGCLTMKQLTLSTDNEYSVKKCADIFGCEYRASLSRKHTWLFPGNDGTIRTKYLQTCSVFGNMPEFFNKVSCEKRIPEEYMTLSVEQRRELVNGLFDTKLSVLSNGNVSYATTSKGLADDISNLLFSLGVPNTIKIVKVPKGKSNDKSESKQYRVVLKANMNKYGLDVHVDLPDSDDDVCEWVSIVNIEKLAEQKETTCIYIDDEEHLYQAGDYIVTHNTEICKQLARILFGENNRSLLRFDMSEFANPESMNRFRTELTARVWERPYSIILLDEIEKSCKEVTRLLLQVLDDGRLMDENSREVSFINSYIVLTTNAGAEIYKTISQYSADDTGSAKMAKEYNKLIRRSISTTTDNKFPPELLGRMDCIVPFQPLAENTMIQICKMKLKALKKEILMKHNIEVKIDAKVADYIVKDNLDTDSNSGGARIIASKIADEVVTNISRFINDNPGVRVIGVKVMGELASENKNKLQSEAYIEVGRYGN